MVDAPGAKRVGQLPQRDARVGPRVPPNQPQRRAKCRRPASSSARRYVWGTGSSAFLVGCRARVFRDNDTSRITDCLKAVAEELSRGNTVEAYGSMLRGKPNNLKHLGPSFFTKFLYAADATDARPGRALILDQFVAVALKDVDCWDVSCTGPWEPNTYEDWLAHAHRIASAEGVRPDAVETAYFNHGRGIA